jgi:hypothetical protein
MNVLLVYSLLITLTTFFNQINILYLNKNIKVEYIYFYKFNWSPRRYCKYAVTNKPNNVTGINPNTMPDKRGSTIFC